MNNKRDIFNLIKLVGLTSFGLIWGYQIHKYIGPTLKNNPLINDAGLSIIFWGSIGLMMSLVFWSDNEDDYIS